MTAATFESTGRDSARRRALVVLGMHRSGTSALARVLSLLGGRLPANLLEAEDTPGNPLGFWEPARIVELHEELLRALGRAWYDLEPYRPEWFTSGLAQGYVSRLAAAVRDEYAEAPLFVVKDPRMSRLVPLWLDVFEQLDVEPLFVLCLRNPLEVAASHAERDRFRLPLSLLLWLRHMLDAERDTRGQKRVVVSYDDLLTDWRPVMARTGSRLGVPWPRLSHTSELEIDDFLRRDARHHTVTDDELESRDDLSPWVRETYGLLRRISRRETQRDLRELDALRAEVDKSELAWGGILHDSLHRLRAERQSASEELARLEEERDASVVELEQARGELEPLKAELAALRDELARTVAAAEQAQGELEHLQAQLTERSADAESARDELSALREEHKQAVHSASLLQARVRDLADRLARKEHELGLNCEELELFAAALAGAQGELETLRAAQGELEVLRSTLTALIASGRIGTPWWRSLSQLVSWAAHGRLRLVRRYFTARRAGDFDALEYLLQHPDVNAAGLNPLMHYVEFGWREGRDAGASALADPAPTVRSAGRSRTLVHLGVWLVRGRVRLVVRYRRSRRRGTFDPAAYLAANPDVAATGMNPLMHYIEHGSAERRPMRPATALDVPTPPPPAAPSPSLGRWRNAVAGVVKRNLPESAAVCLVHAGADDDVDLGPRRVWRLSAEMSGETLVSTIEQARDEGVTHVLVTAQALPLLDKRRGLSDYLGHYARQVMRRDEDCALFYLAGGLHAPAATGGLAEIVSAVVPRAHALVIIGSELDGGLHRMFRLPTIEPNGVMTESLARFRAEGARYLALSAEQLPAFERHDDLRRYVDDNYRVILRRDGIGVVYEAADSPAAHSEPAT